MVHKSVLIAAPIGGTKQYSINLWFEWIARQEYDHIEVALCTNGKGYHELAELVRQVEITRPDGTKLKPIPLELKNSETLTTIQKITYAREKIRRYAKDNNYDYIFFLDTDTIPQQLNTINMLIETQKDAVSGVYFYKNSKVSVLIDEETKTNITLEKIEQAYKNNELLKTKAFGFGCLLLSRPIFTTNEFDYKKFGEERSDDFGYCHQLEQNKVSLWVQPRVMCKHVTMPEEDSHIMYYGTRVIKLNDKNIKVDDHNTSECLQPKKKLDDEYMPYYKNKIIQQKKSKNELTKTSLKTCPLRQTGSQNSSEPKEDNSTKKKEHGAYNQKYNSLYRSDL